jgi:hypothetical protein
MTAGKGGTPICLDLGFLGRNHYIYTLLHGPHGPAQHKHTHTHTHTHTHKATAQLVDRLQCWLHPMYSPTISDAKNAYRPTKANASESPPVRHKFGRVGQASLPGEERWS